MNNMISGKAYVLGNDVDTDQIIPAEHLVYNMDEPEERRLYGMYALSGVPPQKSGLPKGNIPFVPKNSDKSIYKIIIAGKNFGCGSSREHAPAALSIAGVQAVVALSYARIFYRNTVDGGFLIPFESKDSLFNKIRTGDEITIRQDMYILKNITTEKSYNLKSLGEVAGIVETGGLFLYAKRKNLISK
ncbi:3-isopropylmalate dehydratase [bacterium]|nr:3-isopropylmalate dehydratase [bacterium]